MDSLIVALSPRSLTASNLPSQEHVSLGNKEGARLTEPFLLSINSTPSGRVSAKVVGAGGRIVEKRLGALPPLIEIATS